MAQALPLRVLHIIHEYSKPITRANWRSLHKLTNYHLFHCITNDNIPTTLLNVVYINMNSSEWFCMYSFIELWGPTNASIRYGIPTKELLQINGMVNAVNEHNHMNEQIKRLRL